MHAFGFEIESAYDWRSRLAGRPIEAGLKGYANGERVTLRCRFRPEIIAAAWDPMAPLPGLAGPPEPTRETHPAPDTAPAEPPGGWRGRINQTLARATGYELRRAPTRR